MGIIDLLKKAFMEGYATSSITIGTVLICIGCTMLIAVYIYFIYKIVNRNSFYNKGFNISLVIIAVITAAIILTIQSNIVVSLGMVGALSIVRFRTAIKDPMDLAFLFWSISAGIICGAAAIKASAAISNPSSTISPNSSCTAAVGAAVVTGTVSAAVVSGAVSAAVIVSAAAVVSAAVVVSAAAVVSGAAVVSVLPDMPQPVTAAAVSPAAIMTAAYFFIKDLFFMVQSSCFFSL